MNDETLNSYRPIKETCDQKIKKFDAEYLVIRAKDFQKYFSEEQLSLPIIKRFLEILETATSLEYSDLRELHNIIRIKDLNSILIEKLGKEKLIEFSFVIEELIKDTDFTQSIPSSLKLWLLKTHHEQQRT